GHQRPFGGVDHRDVLRVAGVADDEADRGVRRDPVLDDREVEGEQVPIREAVVAWHAVQHGVVDGGADVVPKGTAPERGRIVDVARGRTGSIDHLPRPLVNLEQVGPDPAAGLEALENVADDAAGDPRPVQLARSEDLDHPAPSRQVSNTYTGTTIP